jgi:Tol biopolymer transport system component
MRVRTVGAGLCLVAIALGGCGLLTGIDDLVNVPDPLDASTSSEASAPTPDAPTAPPRCDPEKPFETPTRVMDLSPEDGYEDGDARLSADERTVYFQSTRETDPVLHRVWVSTRRDADASFEPPTLIELESGVSFYAPVVTPDGLTIVMQRGKEGSTLVFATRPDPGAQFLNLQNVRGTNAPGEDERDPFLASDGRLLFARVSAQGADVYIAAGSFKSGFAATALARINSTSQERNPVLSADGRRLFFSSDRDSAAGTRRIFTATREDPTAPFGEPTQVSELAVPGGTHDYDAPTWISEDGCVLYLASNRGSAAGQAHIFVARRPQ